jgi:hypothetical protein
VCETLLRIWLPHLDIEVLQLSTIELEKFDQGKKYSSFYKWFKRIDEGKRYVVYHFERLLYSNFLQFDQGKCYLHSQGIHHKHTKA